MAAICAGLSFRTGPQQRPGDPIACNPTQGHETLTSDPTCDTSGSVVAQVGGERAKHIPGLDWSLCSMQALKHLKKHCQGLEAESNETRP